MIQLSRSFEQDLLHCPHLKYLDNKHDTKYVI